MKLNSSKKKIESKACPIEEIKEVELTPEVPDKKLKVGASLPPDLKENLIHLLQEYAYIFAWAPTNMPDIDKFVAVHKLNVNPGKKLVKQKRRNFTSNRQAAIDEEIDKLLKADLICEIRYPEWLANIIIVKKNNGKWRIYIDYSDLNKVCPKDSYPLPSIDQLIDSTAGHHLLNFLDTLSSYHQIKMAEEDIPKTIF